MIDPIQAMEDFETWLRGTIKNNLPITDDNFHTILEKVSNPLNQ